MCKRVPENNSPTAALQITVEAERKHISSLVVLHKSRHFAMRQRHQPQIPPRESGPFQFSLTFFISESCSVFFFFHQSVQVTLFLILICVPIAWRKWGHGRSQREVVVCLQLQQPSRWAAGSLEAGGTTTSCYTPCSGGEKVTFMLSNTDIHQLSDSLTPWKEDLELFALTKHLDVNTIQQQKWERINYGLRFSSAYSNLAWPPP